MTNEVMKSYQVISKKEQLTLEGISQYYINVRRHQWKYDVLTRLIYNSINIAQCIIYINSKNRLNQIYQSLIQDNFPVGTIHGLQPAIKRLWINLEVAIPDDIHRSTQDSIDVQQLSLVINYDLPSRTHISIVSDDLVDMAMGVTLHLCNLVTLEDLDNLRTFYNTNIEICYKILLKLFLFKKILKRLRIVSYKILQLHKMDTILNIDNNDVLKKVGITTDSGGATKFFRFSIRK